MQTVVLATRNAGKLRELSALFAASGRELRVLGLVDFPEIGDIPETGDTFEENARIKATTVARATGLVAIADDSGLVVDALHGAPGVYSARYSGEQATDAQNVAKVLHNMQGVPKEKRGCHFACVMLAASSFGQECLGHGAWHGFILDAPRGAKGFGYDPVFFDRELGKSAAELDPAVKNARSHRGQALQNLLRGWDAFISLVQK